MKEETKMWLILCFVIWCVLMLSGITPIRSPIRTWRQLYVYTTIVTAFVFGVSMVIFLYIEAEEEKQKTMGEKHATKTNSIS